MNLAKLEEVLRKIEELRKSLEDLVMDKGLEDLDVLNLSQKLDQELNKYYRMLKEKE